jgi:hypothetical protein
MADGVHDATTMRSRVEMAFVVARPWRLGLGCSGAGALAMWQCDASFHVSTHISCPHRTFVSLLISCAVLHRFSSTDSALHNNKCVHDRISEARILSTDPAISSAHNLLGKETLQRRDGMIA